MTYNSYRADFCTESGAKLLADILTSFWKDKGHEVSCRAVQLSDDRGMQLWVVRSELVSGLPKDEYDKRKRQ